MKSSLMKLQKVGLKKITHLDNISMLKPTLLEEEFDVLIVMNGYEMSEKELNYTNPIVHRY